MPKKELSPEEFEELSKQIFQLQHQKGIGVLQTGLSEEEVSRDIKTIFDDIDEQGYEFIHTLEVEHSIIANHLILSIEIV